MEENKMAEENMEELSEEMIDEAVKNEEASEAEKTEEAVEESAEEKALKEAQAKADEYVDKYQRLMAEFYNFRERTTKEKAGMYNDGKRDTVEKILPVIDNLERAVNAQRDKAAEDDAFFKGVDMILKQFGEILTGMGVEAIPAVGETFDPKLHSAVSHIDDENYGENTITFEMLKGYKMGDKVIRHSMVQVAN